MEHDPQNLKTNVYVSLNIQHLAYTVALNSRYQLIELTHGLRRVKPPYLSTHKRAMYFSVGHL